jgi:hypothetical protein
MGHGVQQSVDGKLKNAITGETISVTIDDATVLDDLTITDDLSVGGDATVTGNATVTGTSTLTGVITLPAYTDTTRDALTPAAGMFIYNTTDSKLEVYTGAAWEAVTSAAP